MKKLISTMLLLVFVASCAVAPAAPTVAPTATPAATQTSEPTATETLTPEPTATIRPTATVTATITLTPTPSYPLAGYGPTNFPENINPLTGLVVKNPAIMNRRPVVVKVENLPRDHRPQWGVSSADIVYEYYTEQGGTRFATVFYGSDSDKVGPIRSARFFDFNVVRMYKANLVFGYAYADLYSALINSEFGNRLILEGEKWKGVFTRFEPNGANILQVNTGLLNDVLLKNKVDNSRQKLDGMLFKQQVPDGGQDGTQLFVRFSGGIYNRWDYDPATGKYTRYADAADDVNRNNEKYALLTDRNNGNAIAVDNLVVLQVNHRYIQKPPAEVVDMNLTGQGNAWIARNGKVYTVRWKRMLGSDVLTLTNADGTPFPFKPGQTWYEVNGLSSTVNAKDGIWKFVHSMP